MLSIMKEALLEEHPCKIDQKDGKLRIRFWPKDPKSKSGNCEFTLKLNDNERMKLIHMLSE